MTSFYLDPARAEAYASRVAESAGEVLAAIPVSPASCCDRELDQALATMFRIASAHVRTTGTALMGQARTIRSAIRLYHLTEHHLCAMVEQPA